MHLKKSPQGSETLSFNMFRRTLLLTESLSSSHLLRNAEKWVMNQYQVDQEDLL